MFATATLAGHRECPSLWRSGHRCSEPPGGIPMKRLAVVVASAALAILTPAAASGVDAGPMHRLRAGVAINWAGYIAHTGPFTSASTAWTEPSINCGSNESSALASFVGI